MGDELVHAATLASVMASMCGDEHGVVTNALRLVTCVDCRARLLPQPGEPTVDLCVDERTQR